MKFRHNVEFWNQNLSSTSPFSRPFLSWSKSLLNVFWRVELAWKMYPFACYFETQGCWVRLWVTRKDRAISHFFKKISFLLHIYVMLFFCLLTLSCSNKLVGQQNDTRLCVMNSYVNMHCSVLKLQRKINYCVALTTLYYHALLQNMAL